MSEEKEQTYLLTRILNTLAEINNKLDKIKSSNKVDVNDMAKRLKEMEYIRKKHDGII